MKIYFDSSALAKGFVNEESSDAVRNFIAAAVPARDTYLFTAVITKAEVIAAFAAMRRGRKISQPQLDQAVQQFREQWQYFSIVEATTPVIDTSGEIGLENKIKGCDAFHVASALIIETDLLVSSDNDLNAAALKHGIALWNPMESPPPTIFAHDEE